MPWDSLSNPNPFVRRKQQPQMGKVSAKAVQLRGKLAMFDNSAPTSREFMDLLTRICRDAQLSATQSVNVCNFEWADAPAYRKRIADTDARLQKHSERLGELWPGASLDLNGDPRGYVVKMRLPNGRGDCFAGGVGVA